ncbi:MAG TPA: carboxypeptidase-like regulatory domain-containing protein [Streptosporangiaceae bacterium]|jgi:protocatechuate 3,4-dioxygenase beta subunit
MRLRIAATLAAGVVIAVNASALPAIAGTTSGNSGTPGAAAGAATPASLAQPGLTGAAAHAAATARQAALHARQPAIVTGVVRSFTGRPLTGACVSAAGTGGTAHARTSASGRFTLAGLHSGRVILHVTSCSAGSGYLPDWSGGSPLPGLARSIAVTGGRVTRVAPVTLRPASPAALFAPLASARRAAATRPAVRAAYRNYGGISGQVTGSNGRPATRICVGIFFHGGAEGVPVSSKGVYTTDRYLPPGRYKVEFAPTECNSDPGNWAPQWYRNATTESTATWVRVSPRTMTRHIDGTLRHGGIISGKIASKAGRKVGGVCTVLTSDRGNYLDQASARSGTYRLAGLPTGRYKVYFAPYCTGRSANYLPQWWKNHASYRKANPISVRVGQTISGINAALTAGGEITGTVRLGSSSGLPLAGMCVLALTGSDTDPSLDLVASRKNGRYTINAVLPGRYSVQFDPGCNNNGNYLSDSYPGRVHVTDGKTTSGINGILQPGSSISGMVTGPSGQPLAGVSVEAFANDGNGNGVCTGKKGAFDITQLPADSYTVSYGENCGASANYAPLYYPNQLDPTAAVPVKIGFAQQVTGIDGQMQPGATVTGTVTSRSGQPLKDMCVAVQPTDDSYPFSDLASVFFSADAQTGKAGTYRLDQLSPGRYGVQFGPCGDQPYTSKWFAARPGAPIGDIVDLSVGATMSGISASLAPGGTIAGQFRNRPGKAVKGMCAEAVNLVTGDYAVQADNWGRSSYQLTGLAPGRYKVVFFSCSGVNYAEQWYRGRTGPASAAVVRVTAGHVTGSIDASLYRGAEITGRATLAGTSTPARYFCVTASNKSGSKFGFGETLRDGDYTVLTLTAGSYRLTFSNCQPVHSVVAGEIRPGTVTVTAGRTAAGVNVALPAGGSIAGHALGGPQGSTREGYVCVEADPVSPGGLENTAYTGDTGHYLLMGLLPGKYRVYFDTTGGCDNSLYGLRPQWFQNATTRAAATLVTVTAGQVTPDINATLKADGGISGTVTAAAGGTPLAGACVRAVPVGARAAGRDPSRTASISGAGDYQLTGLAPGQYTVRFSSGCGATGYVTQWWMHASSAAKATAITVHAGEVATGVDGALAR